MVGLGSLEEGEESFRVNISSKIYLTESCVADVMIPAGIGQWAKLWNWLQID